MAVNRKAYCPTDIWQGHKFNESRIAEFTIICSADSISDQVYLGSSNKVALIIM